MYYWYVKFWPDIWIHGQDITTFDSWKQMAAILKFYFRFLFWPSAMIVVWFSSAYQISLELDHPRQSSDVIVIFKMAAVSHVGFGLGQW